MTNLLNGIINLLAVDNWAEVLFKDLRIYLIVFFVAVASVAAAYAVYLAFLLAKAEDQGKRQQAKKRIWQTLIGLLIIVVLAVTMYSESFIEAITGKKKSGEWSVDLKGAGAIFCKTCSEWQWTGTGDKQITLLKHAKDEKGGFEENGESYNSNPLRVQLVSWTPYPAPNPLPTTLSAYIKGCQLNCTGKYPACSPAGAGAACNFSPGTGGLVRTIGGITVPGATGTVLTVSGNGVAQISISYYDKDLGSFKEAIPVQKVRITTTACSQDPHKLFKPNDKES